MPNRLVIKDRAINSIPEVATTRAALMRRAGRAFRGIPNPTMDLAAIYETTAALKEMVEVITRQRGLVDDSAILVNEFESVIHRLENRIATNEVTTDRIDEVFHTQMSAEGGTPATSSSGDFINYTSVNLPANPGISFDLVTGIATIEQDGLYEVSGSLQMLDGQKDEDYRMSVVISGTQAIDEVLGSSFWNNKQDLAIVSYDYDVVLFGGDTVKQTFSVSPGGSATSFGHSHFSVGLSVPQ